MKVTPSGQWNEHWRLLGSSIRTGSRPPRTLRQQNFGMTRGMNFGMTKAARAAWPNSALSSMRCAGWGARTRTWEWRKSKSLAVGLYSLFAGLALRISMSHHVPDPMCSAVPVYPRCTRSGKLDADGCEPRRAETLSIFLGNCVRLVSVRPCPAPSPAASSQNDILLVVTEAQSI
jgi:hypothetical protein